MDILRNVYGSEHPEVYKAHNGLGNCFANLKDSVRAEAAYLKALRGIQSTDGPGSMAVAQLYQNLGILYNNYKNRPLARKYWFQSIALLKTLRGPHALDVATRLSWIANNYDEEGLYDEALNTINAALKTLHPHADTTHGACSGSAIQADAAGQLAFARAMNIKGKIHHDRFLAHHKKADLDCAFTSLRIGLATSDSVRMGYHGSQAQLAGLEVSYRYFEEILLVCLAQYQLQKDPQWLDRAFFYMEKSKSNLLNSAIRLSSVSNQTANLQWLSEERALRRQIDSLEIKSYELGKSGLPKHHPDLVRLRQEIFHAQEDLQTFLSEVEATDPQYYALRYGTQVPSLAEMRQSLPDANTLLLEYFVGEDNLFILAMSAADVRIVQLPLDSLGSEVEAFLRQFDARSHNLLHAKRNFIESAQALYARLIRPVAELLPDQGRIVVVPDGKLGYVPFEALLNDAVAIAPTTAYRDMPYLLRSHSVGYASSAVAMRLIAPRERRKSEMRLLAFAPTFENEQLSGAFAQATTVENKAVAATRSAMIQSPLHYTSEEVQRISRYFKGEVFQGPAATESQFKRSAQDYNILHFATHGDIQDGNPMFSGIAFSAEGEAGKEDGMLHTLELFDMNLQAELAVLSACNTGKGVIQRGEGVMSLARGFMYAGCPSIVMSLWSVDDAASASIMDEFYRQLSKGKSKDAALRAAKFSYLDAADESKAHPYYWAAHVMIGDPSGFRGNYQGWAWGAVILCLVAVIVVFEVRKYA
jgi:CHAT domain-containing protein